MLCWFSRSYCSPCHCGFAFLLKCFCFSFLDGSSSRLDSGLPSPLRSPVEGEVSGAKHVLAGAFQQPRALHSRAPHSIFDLSGEQCRLLNTGTFQRPSGTPPCLQLPRAPNISSPTTSRHLWPHVLSMMSVCRHLNSSWAWQCPCQVSSKVSEHKFTL